MSVVRWLWPADTIGVGDFLSCAAGITICLWFAHHTRSIPPLSRHCRARISAAVRRQETRQ